MSEQQDSRRYILTRYLYMVAAFNLETMSLRMRQHKSWQLFRDFVHHWETAEATIRAELGHDNFRIVTVDVFEDGVEPRWELVNGSCSDERQPIVC